MESAAEAASVVSTVEAATKSSTMEAATAKAPAMEAAATKTSTMAAATTKAAAMATTSTPPPRASAIVGAARPTDATANNAITSCNITILRQKDRSQPRHFVEVAMIARNHYSFGAIRTSTPCETD